MDAITSTSPINDPKKQPEALRTLLGRTNRDWWPEQLTLELLRPNGPQDPMGDGFKVSRRVQDARLSGAEGRTSPR
jgi:catalase-peroxidase